MVTSTLAGFLVLSVSAGQCSRPAPVYPGTWAPPPAVRYWQRPVPVVTPYMPVIEKKDAPAKEKSLYERLGGEEAHKAGVDDFRGRAAGDPQGKITRRGPAPE